MILSWQDKQQHGERVITNLQAAINAKRTDVARVDIAYTLMHLSCIIAADIDHAPTLDRVQSSLIAAIARHELCDIQNEARTAYYTFVDYHTAR